MSRVCEVPDDGATGGSKAQAILALLAEYRRSGNVKYLNDATMIGHWITANLTDSTATGFRRLLLRLCGELSAAPRRR